MPLIIGIIILVLGGICVAFDVSLGGALLIILGVLAFIIIIALIFNAAKSEKGKTVIVIIALILLAAFCIFGLAKCFGEIGGTTSDDGSWEKCLKCGGDGKVVNDLGYNVSCPRCNGVGYLP